MGTEWCNSGDLRVVPMELRSSVAKRKWGITTRELGEWNCCGGFPIAGNWSVGFWQFQLGDRLCMWRVVFKFSFVLLAERGGGKWCVRGCFRVWVMVRFKAVEMCNT